MGKKRPRRCAKCGAAVQPNGRFCEEGHLDGKGTEYVPEAQKKILAGLNGFGQKVERLTLGKSMQQVR